MVPLSFFASILAKEPQNLTVSLLITPHWLVRDEILRVESILWSLKYFATLPLKRIKTRPNGPGQMGLTGLYPWVEEKASPSIA